MGQPALVELRPVRADEVAAAHAVEVASYPEAEAASVSRFADRRDRFPEGFLGLFERGRLAALLCAVRTSAEDLGDERMKAEGGHDPLGRDLVILSVATHPERRRRGHAGLLLGAIALTADLLGIARIRLACKAALVPFYARHGYRLVGDSACRHGGAAWVEMERG